MGVTVPLNGGAVPVAGILHAWFEAPFPGSRCWQPLKGDALLAETGLSTGSRTLAFITVGGRLGDGVQLADAQQRLGRLARSIDIEVGKDPEQYRDPALIALLDDTVGGVRVTPYLILGAAAIGLLGPESSRCARLRAHLQDVSSANL